MVAAMNLIAIDDKSADYQLNENACGRIVYWQLSGTTNLDGLKSNLAFYSAPVKAPESPSPLVCLHRAVDEVAREEEASCRSLGRGAWAIASKAREEEDEHGKPRLVSDIVTRAELTDNDTVRVRGEHGDVIGAAYERAQHTLSTQDMSKWLCDTIAALGAVAMRDSGGFYFVPRDVCDRWDATARAVQASSGHKLFGVPALKSADALDAILAAVTSDTEKAVAELMKDVPTLGKRGLETRERELRDLSDRTSRYEGILGKKLDDLRASLAGANAGVAAAMFAQGADDAE